MTGNSPSTSQKTVMIDGYNLGLERGTGVATYARNLSYELHGMGHKVSVLYGNRGALNRDELLREIAFFDGSVEQPRLVELLERIRAGLRLPFRYEAKPIPISGRVISRSFDARLPYFDQLYNFPDVFKNAQSAYWVWRRLMSVKLPEKPDLVHWTYPLPLTIPGRPNLYTFHDLVPLKLPYTTLDNKRRYLKLMRLLARKADHIVTVSENSRRDIIELLGVDEDRVTNSYQSVQIPAKFRDKPQDQVAREVEGVTGFGYKQYFLFWGSLEPKKNIGRMIEAYLASGVTTPLVIIGAQAWKAEKELALLNEAKDKHSPFGALERRRGARKRIIRLDYVPFGMLVSLIRGAKAALFPSLYEGFGLPALEAMLLETPVICSNVSSLPEVVGDAALQVDPYDASAISAAIRTLDSDADMREELAQKSGKQAALFGPQAHRERLGQIYAKYF